MKKHIYYTTLFLGLLLPVSAYSIDSLTVDATGQVGMGTATPGSQLEVQDNQRIEIRMNNTVAENWRITSRGTGLEYGVVATTDPGNVTLGKKMTLSTGGDLVVTGSIAVNATILTVPDYVFAESYNLMPLDKLKTFINKEKHLPNVASESDIKKSKTLDIGANQMKHLEKIEELTLYTLQQHEQIKSLRKKVAENSKMKERLASLEKLITNLASSGTLLSENGNEISIK